MRGVPEGERRLKRAGPDARTWAFILGLVLVQSLLHGVDLFAWKDYGFSMWRSGSAISALDPIQSVLQSHTTFVRSLFDRWSASIYESPSLFILASTLVRLAQMALCYEIFFFACGSRRPAMLALAIFAFSFGIFPWPQIGLIGSPILLAASLSAAVSLAGILQLLKGRWLAAALLLGLACHLHAFYGLSLLPPIVLGLLLRSWRLSSRKALAQAALFALAAGAAVAPLALVQEVSQIPQTVLSVGDWYAFLMARDPDDVLMLYSVGQFGLAIAGASLFYFYIRREEPDRGDLLECVLLGALLFAGFCAAVELAQRRGVFLGHLSELFIAMQFRRGLWLTALAVVPLTIRELGRPDRPATAFLCALACLWPLMVEFQSAILPLGFVGALLIAALADRPRRGGLSALAAASLLIALTPYFPRLTVADPRDKASALMLALGTLGGAAAFRLVAAGRIGLLAAALPFVLLPPLITGAKDLRRGRGLVGDLGAIRAMIPGKAGYDELAELTAARSLVMTGNSGAKEYKFADEEERLAYRDALRELKVRAKGVGIVLANPAFRLDPRSYSGMPVALFEYQDRALSTYSRPFAANYDHRLRLIFGQGLDWFYRDEGYAARFRDAFRELPADRLRELGRTGAVRYLVSDRPYRGLRALYANERFRVYDLAP